MDQKRNARQDVTGLGAPLCYFVIVRPPETKRDQRKKGHVNALSALGPEGPDIQWIKKKTRQAITDRPWFATGFSVIMCLLGTKNVTKGAKGLTML